MSYLPLEWPAGIDAVLGRAGGATLVYRLKHVAHGCWLLSIEANKVTREREFMTERAAKGFARDDFRRRQFVRLACRFELADMPVSD
jgi:hypothetical protein